MKKLAVLVAALVVIGSACAPPPPPPPGWVFTVLRPDILSPSCEVNLLNERAVNPANPGSSRPSFRIVQPPHLDQWEVYVDLVMVITLNDTARSPELPNLLGGWSVVFGPTGACRPGGGNVVRVDLLYKGKVVGSHTATN